MLRRAYYNGPGFIEDLKSFDSANTIVSIIGKVKNIERLKDLRITELWLTNVNDAQIQEILLLTKPEFLSVYQMKVDDLSVLETLTDIETLVLQRNTKAEKLWDLSENPKLKSLVLGHFPKIASIDAIAGASNLEYLVIEGGMDKAMNIDNLDALSHLSKLEFLRLASMRVKTGGLKSLGNLKSLKELMLSNQFETSDYAYLKANLPNTSCTHFAPFIKPGNVLGDKDTMITGKGFLNSKTDKDKLEKFVAEFNALVMQYSQ